MRSKYCGTGALSVQEVVMHHLSIKKETNKGYQKIIMMTRRKLMKLMTMIMMITCYNDGDDNKHNDDDGNDNDNDKNNHGTMVTV